MRGDRAKTMHIEPSGIYILIGSFLYIIGLHTFLYVSVTEPGVILALFLTVDWPAFTLHQRLMPLPLH